MVVGENDVEHEENVNWEQALQTNFQRIWTKIVDFRAKKSQRAAKFPAPYVF